MLKSMFKSSVEGHAKELQNYDQTYFTGVLVKSSDVVQNLLDDPWFLAFSNMSPIETAIARDANKVGISVVAPPRHPNEKYRIFLNPCSLGMYSGSSGKTEGVSSTQAGGTSTKNFMLAHMIAQTRETPTLFGVLSRSITTTDSVANTQVTDQEQQENTSVAPFRPFEISPESNIPDVSLPTNGILGSVNKNALPTDRATQPLPPSIQLPTGGIFGFTNRNNIGSVDSSSSIGTSINPSTGKVEKSKYSNTTPIGTNAATGTKMKPSSSVRSPLIGPITPHGSGVDK